MAYSSTIITITAGEVGDTEFDLTFEGAVANPPGYIAKAHIFMWLNDIQVTEGGGAAEYDSSGITFSWVTSTRVSVSGYSGVLDDKVEFRRTIPKDKPVVDFVDRAGITEAQLDKQSLANLYSVHEIMDGFGTGTQNYYALAKLYANADEDYEVETGNYSAKHFSIKASASASAASASETAAAASEAAAAASEAQTISDAAATAADLVQTNLDQISCAADAVSTAADAAATAADLVQTDIDQAAAAASAAAASTSETNAATSETNAAASETAAAASETAAGLSETAAAASEAKAEDWAEELEDVEVETGKYSALHWAAKAEAAAESGLYRESEHTATAGQTVFTHTADVQNEQISVNGAILADADYTISASTQITLTAGAAAGDIVRIQTIGLIAVNEYVALSGNASEQMTGPLYLQGNPTADDYAANKAYVDALAGGNLLDNGGLNIWQRGGTFGTVQQTTADRWECFHSSSHTGSASQQTFTVGQTDVTGSPLYFHRLNIGGAGDAAASYAYFGTKLERVSRFENKDVTFSFWAKADAAKTISLNVRQVFGTGGSADVNIAPIAFSLTSSWAKYTTTISLPSISGKTVNTADSYLRVMFWVSGGTNYSDYHNSIGIQTGSFDFAQLKLEEGSEATPFVARHFETELALCQRYYQTVRCNARIYATASGYIHTTGVHWQVRPRTTPTVTLLTAPTTAKCTYAMANGGADGSRFTITPTSAGDCYALDAIYEVDAEL